MIISFTFIGNLLEKIRDLVQNSCGFSSVYGTLKGPTVKGVDNPFRT